MTYDSGCDDMMIDCLCIEEVALMMIDNSGDGVGGKYGVVGTVNDDECGDGRVDWWLMKVMMTDGCMTVVRADVMRVEESRMVWGMDVM
ncbi:hypothetical protein Pcinc_014457 [Petrolisthes cinctipes]|uniref:Uncharacterized protein n=1 Tax=Petrolisthes cinctipes TaxID=88211 RepID=A0AAE1FUZ4_PETCI|nr:hypothetical protein Pcinc_014457 [Petrolisthes cinctipes]